MMPRIGMALIAACFAFSTAAYAQSGEEFAKSKCLACHAVDQKKVGPSFKEISAAHRGDKGAEAQLPGMLKRGKGHPKIEASDVQLKAVIQYVLKQ
jgi:cytochrome c